MKTLQTLIFCLIVILGVSSVANAAPVSQLPSTILYVKPGITGDCLSWVAACDLQTALSIANPGDQIWVAAGTYKPTDTDSRSISFQLESGVMIYGGFPTAGGLWTERDWVANPTTLSGDIGTVGNIADNSYHVVTGNEVGQAAIMDGFIITGGNASGTLISNGTGGGMFNINSHPTLTNIIFAGNSVSRFGGGMYNNYSNPTLNQVTFSGNSANYGGGMSNDYSNPTLTNVTFTGNSASYGGGMDTYYCNPSLTNVTFSANSASMGGGMYNQYNSSTLTNVTFSANSASSGGGMYNLYSSPTLTNAILWGNMPDQIHNESGAPPVTYSVIQNWTSGGTGNTNADPKLGPLADHGGFNHTHALGAGSSAIDAGDPAVCPATDQRGFPRPLDGDGNESAVCDIGAYEAANLYVTEVGMGECTSWADACDMQIALSKATAGNQTWVAAGTYKPTDTSDRSVSFQLESGVAIYGGFPTAGGMWAERDAVANLTTFSGDIGTFDNYDDDSYHVVTGNEVDETAIMDGLSISYGNANGTFPYDRGGGMYNTNSHPTLTNITVSGNLAAEYGGGIYNNNSSPTLNEVTFNGNLAIYGGGMFNEYCNPTLTNVTFFGNAADYGAGMNNNFSNPTLLNVTFSANPATSGGGMYNDSSNPTLTNVTFVDNTASSGGGGMSNIASSPTLINAIFWGNWPDQIYDDSGTPLITYSVIQDWTSGGTGNTSADPLLFGRSENGGFTLTHALKLGSSAIDVGDPSVCPATDQRGFPRPLDGDGDGSAVCDIGAYEYANLYVTEVGIGDCLSWADACDLQIALSKATRRDQVWVAAGTYKPTDTTDRGISFQLESGVAIYGGFPTAGGMWAERDWAANLTTLSGDIGTVGNIDDNSYHVVTGNEVGQSAVMDGFIITGGNANGTNIPDRKGGGMSNTNSHPTLTNIVFTGNSTNYAGGGIYNYYSSPTLKEVTFTGNTAINYYGGGMYNYFSSPTLDEVTFSGNSANYGGGMSDDYSNPTLTNVTFTGNSASYGGGMFNNYSYPTLINVTIAANSASSGGGIYNIYSSPTMTNVTFANNIVTSNGGGIYNIYSSPTMTNAILWGNTPDQIYTHSGTPLVTYSVIQDWTSGGTGNTNADLFLGPLADNGGFTQTHALRTGSSAIDAGNPAVCTDTDQRGFPRPLDGNLDGTVICDIGAYEYKFEANLFLPVISR